MLLAGVISPIIPREARFHACCCHSGLSSDMLMMVEWACLFINLKVYLNLYLHLNLRPP